MEDGDGAAEISSARAWTMVGVVTVLYVLSFVDRAVLGLLAIPIRRDLGLSDVQLSLLLGLSIALFYSVLSLPAGYLVDRFSRRRIIGVGVLLWSFMTIGCGLSRTYWQLFAGRVGVGVGESALSPASFSLIRHVLPPERRGRAYAVYSLGPALGSGVALLIGGFLIGRLAGGVTLPVVGHLQPWQAVLVFLGALGIPGSLLALTLREPVRQVHAYAKVLPSGGFGEALRFFWRNKRVYAPIAAFGALMSMVAFSYSAWLPTLVARTWHIAPPQIGLRLGLITVVCAPVGALVTGATMDRITRRGRRDGAARVGFLTSTLVLVFAAAIPFMASFGSALVLIGCYLLVNGTFYAIGATALASVTPTAMMGRFTAMYLLLQGLFGQGLGPTVVATVEKAMGGPEMLGMALSVSASCMAVGGLLCLAVMRPALGAHNMRETVA